MFAIALFCITLAPQDPPEFAPDAPPAYRAADESLRIVSIDRALNESFIAVRVDSAGRIFLGGREAVFVLEPDDKGGYKPRVELFRFPPHSWVGDIEIRGDDLYVATAAAIYRLPEARRKRDDIKAEKIVWGTPVDLHVTYHGLAFGPEGDLYFNSGDPLLNYGDWQRPDHFGHWTIFHGPDGKATPYTGVGAVYRCKPDGSNLQVVATGLRGSDGLCFSETWDLFTNDNDHESIPDRYTPFRILHVTPGVDFGWPRGWAARRSPERADLIDPINEGLGRGVPVGMCYYGDTHLPKTYHQSLLVAQWGHRRVTAYKLWREGASFSTTEHPLLLCEDRARPVGVCVGTGGRVFVTIAYMAQNEGSPTYPSELLMISRQAGKEAELSAQSDSVAATRDNLYAELSNSSWSRRSAAYQEILRRGAEALDQAVWRWQVRTPSDDLRLGIEYQIGMWLAANDKRNQALSVHRDLATGTASVDTSIREMQIESVEILAHFLPAAHIDRELLEKTLRSPEARLQLSGVIFSTRVAGWPLDLLQNDPSLTDDRVVHQAVGHLLARRASVQQLHELLNSPNPKLRLAGVLAVGMRLTIPEPLAPLPDELPLNYTSPNALFTVNYANETVNLRELGRVGSFTIAEYWKAVPHTDEQDQLFNMLMKALDDENEGVRLQAAYYLSLVNDARSEPAIAKVTGESELRKLDAVPWQPVSKIWGLGPIPAPAGTNIETHPIDLTTVVEKLTPWTLSELPNGKYYVPGPSGYVTYHYFRLQAQRPRRAMVSVAFDQAVKILHNGRTVYENEVGVIPGFRNVATIPLIAGSNDILIRLDPAGKNRGVAVEIRASEGVSVTIPERLGIEGLADRLKAGTTDAAVSEAFLKIDWPEAAKRGDAERGRKLFSADGIGCAKCHAIASGDAGAGAPSLADARGRFTVTQVVESILTPSAQVANEFRGTVLALKDGRLVNGLVTSETADAVEVLLPDATKTRIAVSEIEERKAMDQSPMPGGLVKTPDELADLLAYLLKEHTES